MTRMSSSSRMKVKRVNADTGEQANTNAGICVVCRVLLSPGLRVFSLPINHP